MKNPFPRCRGRMAEVFYARREDIDRLDRRLVDAVRVRQKRGPTIDCWSEKPHSSGHAIPWGVPDIVQKINNLRRF